MENWPELPPLERWQDTHDTLHRWLQIVGKIRLAHTPWTNHSWHVPFYVTANGLTTSIIHTKADAFEVEFDFVDHRLRFSASSGERRSFPLTSMPVAEFYDTTMRMLRELGIETRIWPMPVEIPDPISPLDADREHATYSPEPVTRFWHAAVAAQRVFQQFRARFVGKVSPVHLFWGGFDLAVTRFSGRTAPPHPGGIPHCARWIMEDAYSHEVSSAGFWPGAGLGEAAFYSYTYPEPPGFRDFAVRPAEAYYHEGLRELILPYRAVRASGDPDAALMAFLQSSYEAAAELARWDRHSLERTEPVHG